MTASTGSPSTTRKTARRRTASARAPCSRCTCQYRLQVRPERQQADAGGEREAGGDRDESLADPLARPRRRRRDEHEGRKREQVDRRQRLQHEPDRQLQRVPCVRFAQDRVQRRERERQELHVQRLQMGKPGQRVRVEGGNHPGRGAAGPAAGPARRHEARRPAGQREAGEQHQVVDQQRRRAQPDERRAEHALDQHRLRVRQRVAFGKEDVRVEQVERVADDLMRHPGEGPLVQHRVAVVVARKRRWARGQRPGMHDCQQREEQECRSPRVQAHDRSQRLAESGSSRPRPGRSGRRQQNRAADPFEAADHEQLPSRHAFRRELPGRNRGELGLLAHRPHQLERRRIALVSYLDEDEVRATSEPDFRRSATVDLHGRG